MRQAIALILTNASLLIVLRHPMLPVQAQLTYQQVERSRAIAHEVQVQVTPGRATAISFSQTDETITYILLADPSRSVYTTDVELETGRAKTVFLRVIQPLRFPGSTTAAMTNLVIQTKDSRGQQRLYSFDIVYSRNPRYVGVQILPVVRSRGTDRF